MYEALDEATRPGVAPVMFDEVIRCLPGREAFEHEYDYRTAVASFCNTKPN